MSIKVILPTAFTRHTDGQKHFDSAAANLPALLAEIDQTFPALVHPDQRRRRQAAAVHQHLHQRRRHPLPRRRNLRLPGRRRGHADPLHRRRLPSRTGALQAHSESALRRLSDAVLRFRADARCAIFAL